MMLSLMKKMQVVIGECYASNKRNHQEYYLQMSNHIRRRDIFESKCLNWFLMSGRKSQDYLRTIEGTDGLKDIKLAHKGILIGEATNSISKIIIFSSKIKNNHKITVSP